LVVVLLLGACSNDDAPFNDGGASTTYECTDDLELDAGNELWPGHCARLIDQGADGRIDFTWTLEYDGANRLVQLVIGQPPAGYQKRWTYDDRGDVLLEEYDEGLDDVWDTNIERSYDDHGNLLTEVTDADGDGAPDRVLRYSYACLAASENAKKPGPCTTEIDEEADGVGDFIEERTYDEAERLLTVSQNAVGSVGLIHLTTHRYDAAGDRIETTIDVGADDDIEELFERSYDSDHRLLRECYDQAADGSIERQHDYDYDASGALIREELREGGELVHRFDYERDQRGLVIRETKTYVGLPENDTELRRYHDTADNPVLEVFKFRESRSPDSCTRYDYACFD
jgi:hypothetical protein